MDKWLDYESNIGDTSVKLTLTVVFFSVCWLTFSRISIKPASEIWQKAKSSHCTAGKRKNIGNISVLRHQSYIFLPFLPTSQNEPFEWDSFQLHWPSLASPKQDCSLKKEIKCIILWSHVMGIYKYITTYSSHNKVSVEHWMLIQKWTVDLDIVINHIWHFH